MSQNGASRGSFQRTSNSRVLVRRQAPGGLERPGCLRFPLGAKLVVRAARLYDRDRPAMHNALEYNAVDLLFFLGTLAAVIVIGF